MDLQESEQTALRLLLKRFLEENALLNLTALRTEEACFTGNILDSLPFLDLLKPKGPLPFPSSMVDIGTGGGFPLLPIAMMLPTVQCTGIDATKKKIVAVGHIVSDLHLQNVTLLAERAEVAGHSPRHREQYDMVLARAVAPLSNLLEFTIPFAKPQGFVVLWKSMHIEQELQESIPAQRELHCTLQRTLAYDLGGDWGKRQLLVFSKGTPTPKIYPRAVGMVKKMPIGEPITKGKTGK